MNVLPQLLPLVHPAGITVPDGYRAGSERAWATAEAKVPRLRRRASRRVPALHRQVAAGT